MANYAVFIYVPEVLAPGPDHDDHSDVLAREGSLRAAFALASGPSVVLREDLVIDGPFIETKEVIAGLYVVEADDRDMAIALARRNPALREGARLEVHEVAASRIESPTRT